MRISSRAVCLLAAVSLAASLTAVPATAVAQSAGDDQYVDPFQNNEKGGGNDASAAGSSQGDKSTPADSAPQSTPADSAPQGASGGKSDGDSSAGTSSDSDKQSDDGQVSRAGGSGGGSQGWMIAAGVIVVLLGGGFAVWRLRSRPS